MRTGDFCESWKIRAREERGERGAICLRDGLSRADGRKPCGVGGVAVWGGGGRWGGGGEGGLKKRATRTNRELSNKKKKAVSLHVDQTLKKK